MQINFFSITAIIACLITVSQSSLIKRRQGISFDQKVQTIKADPQVQDFLDGFINLVSADMEEAGAGATFDDKLEKVKGDPSVEYALLNTFTELIAEGIEKQNDDPVGATDDGSNNGGGV